MRSKKQIRSLLPGVRRLLKLLADGHPMVLMVASSPREEYHERGYHGEAYLQPERDRG
jgi:hypothetical protein